MSVVEVEQRDRVAIVTLNDPDRRNALNAEIVDRGAMDPEVVVTPGIYVDTVVEIPAPAQPDPREDSQ